MDTPRAVMQRMAESNGRQNNRELLGPLPRLKNQSQVWTEVMVGGMQGSIQW